MEYVKQMQSKNLKNSKEPIHICDYDALIREVLESSGEFRIYPHGSSMLPLLREGVDSVSIVKANGVHKLSIGDIIFYQRTDGHYVLHRIVDMRYEGLVLCGDHQFVCETGVSEENVIGVVNRIFRKQKEIKIHGPGYRLYVWLWSHWIWRRFYLKMERFLFYR